MQAEYFALEGISELISTLERVRSAYNPDLAIEGVLLTMYDDRTNLAQQVTETLREYFREIVYRTVIPRNVRLAEAPSHGKPVALYDSAIARRRSVFRDDMGVPGPQPNGESARRGAQGRGRRPSSCQECVLALYVTRSPALPGRDQARNSISFVVFTTP